MNPLSDERSSSPPSRVLVLGFGNPGRQDDGLGPAAAAEIEKLNWPSVTARDNYQLVLEDALEIAAHDVVWFVDAARGGTEPFEVRRVSSATNIAFTSHLLSAEVLLAVCQKYFESAPEAFQVGIRGYEFEFEEGLTAGAQRNLLKALKFIQSSIATRLGSDDEYRPREQA